MDALQDTKHNLSSSAGQARGRFQVVLLEDSDDVKIDRRARALDKQGRNLQSAGTVL